MARLNAAQRGALEWIAAGCVGEAPSPEWKTSARALETRGLVSVSRPGGVFTAVATEAGREFLERSVEAPEKTRPTPTKPKAAQTQVAKAASPSSASQRRPRVVNPHPAVQSLRARPVALPEGAEARAQAILAAHSLVIEAQRAGFEVIGHEQPKQRQGGGHHPHTGSAFITIKTHQGSYVINIGEQVRQMPHELTEAEKKDKARGGYGWGIPKYDYLPTGKTFFRIPNGYNAKKFLETRTKTLVEYVPRVIEYIHTQEREAQEREERERIRKEQEAAAAAARLVLQKRRAEYDAWESVLIERAEAWDRIQRLRAYVNAVRNGPRTEAASKFVAWADLHLDALDPARAATWPDGDAPGLTHDERLQYGPYQTQRSSGTSWTGLPYIPATRPPWAGRAYQ